jgi:hypothetical protein
VLPFFCVVENMKSYNYEQSQFSCQHIDMWKKHWYKTRQWFSNLHAVFSMQFVGGGDSIGAKQLDQH